MIVCSCYALTEADLRAAIRAHRAGVHVDCPAGQDCGSCCASLERIAAEEAAQAEQLLGAESADQSASAGLDPHGSQSKIAAHARAASPSIEV